MKWLIMIIATEAIVEILSHSELFAWLRKRKPFDCSWCLSVWVAGAVFGLMTIGLWWIPALFAISRMSNLFHEIYGILRENAGGRNALS